MEKQALAGRYAVGERIGAGGMADVFTARDTRLERDVAIKIFRPGTADGLERGSAEARMLAGLDHPGLVRVLDMDSGEHHDGAYLVMELVDGPDLRDMLKAGGPLGQEDVRVMALDLARTLQYIHGRGIVHRDMKPSNILTRQADPESGLFRYLLTDFGIARFFDGTRVTATGQVIGSAAYFSPEQTRGDGVGQPSDIYSLGLVMIEALTGDRAFPGTGVESALARLHRSPSVPHAAGPALSALLVSMTLDEPGDRPDAAQVVRALTAMGPQREDHGATTVLPAADSPTAAMPAFAGTLPTIALPASDVPVPQRVHAPQDDATRRSGVAPDADLEDATRVSAAGQTHVSGGAATRAFGVAPDADLEDATRVSAAGPTRVSDAGATALSAPAPLDPPSVRPSTPISAERPLPPEQPPSAADGAIRPEPRRPAAGNAPPRAAAAHGRRRSVWLLVVLVVAVLAAVLWVVVLQIGGDAAPAVDPLPAVPGETGQRLQELYESVKP